MYISFTLQVPTSREQSHHLCAFVSSTCNLKIRQCVKRKQARHAWTHSHMYTLTHATTRNRQCGGCRKMVPAAVSGALACHYSVYGCIVFHFLFMRESYEWQRTAVVCQGIELGWPLTITKCVYEILFENKRSKIHWQQNQANDVPAVNIKVKICKDMDRWESKGIRSRGKH